MLSLHPFLKMKSFKEIKKLFDFSIPDMINEIMLELNDEIIELNQVEQLSEGVDALGQRIRTISAEEQGEGNVYGFQSINERSAKGLQVDNVDLKITGSFWSTFKVKKVSDGWEIQVDYNVHGDDIMENFESKYDFTGLTPDNLDYLVNQLLMPRLDKRINAKTGL